MRDFQKEIERIVENFVAEVLRVAGAKAASMLEAELGERRARLAVADAVRQLRRVQRLRGPTGRPGRPLGIKAVKRTPDQLQVLADKFVACVKETPGLRMEQINPRLMTSTRKIRKPVAKLVAAGLIRTQGEKRARRYFVADAVGDDGQRAAVGDEGQRASRQHDHAAERGGEAVAA